MLTLYQVLSSRITRSPSSCEREKGSSCENRFGRRIWGVWLSGLRLDQKQSLGGHHLPTHPAELSYASYPYTSVRANIFLLISTHFLSACCYIAIGRFLLRVSNRAGRPSTTRAEISQKIMKASQSPWKLCCTTKTCQYYEPQVSGSWNWSNSKYKHLKMHERKGQGAFYHNSITKP